ncbi:MAG: metal ABC transporter permease [Bacteroidota bacterium]
MLEGILGTYGYLFIGVVVSLSSTAIIGVFSALQKKELAGDAIAHATLPGVALSFIITGLKAPLYLTIGSFLSGMGALLLIDYLPGRTNLKKDSVMALIIAMFFGVGLLLLSYIQHHPTGSAPAGLSHWLLGDVPSLVDEDIKAFFLLAVGIGSTLFCCYHQWMLYCFDPAFAQSIGLPVKRLQWLFQSLTVLAIILGIQTVGIILITAVLVTPVTAARFWSDRLGYILGITAFLASLAGCLGMVASYYFADVPTGPVIVLIMTLLSLASFLFAPKKGLLAKKWRLYQYQQKVLEENILKLFYQVLQKEGCGYDTPQPLSRLLEQRALSSSQLLHGLNRLKKKRLVTKKGSDLFQLTLAGKEKGEKILRLHELWEAYLRTHLHIQPSHVHDDAESIEHLITPAIEKDLNASLAKVK